MMTISAQAVRLPDASLLYACDVCASVNVGRPALPQLGIDWEKMVLWSVVCQGCMVRWNGTCGRKLMPG